MTKKQNIKEKFAYESILIIKSRYTSQLLFSLKKNPKSFSNLQRDIPPITNMQLTRNLKQLQNNDIIEKINKDYTLTEKGIKLIKIIDSLGAWFQKYN